MCSASHPPQDPESCAAAQPLTPLALSAELPGAASRACSAAQAAAEGRLTTVAALLRTLPQLSRLYGLLRTASLSSIPGSSSITVLAPSNASFGAALAAGELTQAQLDDPQAARQLVLAHIVPVGALQVATLAALRSVTTAANATLPTAAGAAGAVEVGGAPVVTPDLLASNGVVQILGALIVPDSLRQRPAPEAERPAVALLPAEEAQAAAVADGAAALVPRAEGVPPVAATAAPSAAEQALRPVEQAAPAAAPTAPAAASAAMAQRLFAAAAAPPPAPSQFAPRAPASPPSPSSSALPPPPP